MNGVNYLLGSADITTNPLRIFSDAACSFVSDLSGALMADGRTRNMPDVMSLAFWCRRANIKRLREGWATAELRLGRGLAFHVTPANVPVNFAFSYIFSVLAGNANIVRVPSRPFAQIDLILETMKRILDEHPAVKERTAVVSYSSADDEVTAAFCARADARIIWGGDVTVEKIRAFKSKPRCQDICFPDRFSLAVLDGLAVEEADEAAMRSLARNFYNDTYLMDQNACSSPQIIFWQKAAAATREKFWRAVEAEVRDRYILQAASAVDKFDQSCRDAVNLEGHLDHIDRQGNLVYRVSLSSLPPEAETRLRGSCGYFYEADLDSLDLLKDLVSDKCQTLTYYGPSPEALLDFVLSEGLPGIDRIVPIGSALDIGLVWDGFDLIRSLSRQVEFAWKGDAGPGSGQVISALSEIP